jgi:hypothetical protein
MLLATAVLLELFTSEGCSSCPPADALLARLSQSQPVAGVELVVVSEHVDYWDDLGWKDPFSSSIFSERQTRHRRRAYTPQAVVDGREDMVGSDENDIRKAAKAAAAQPHGLLQLSTAADGKSIKISATSLPPHGPAKVLVATVEDALESRVTRGENAGRTLRHVAVARSLHDIGVVPGPATQWSGEAILPTDAAARRTRTVVFVEEVASGRILATAAR